jgi:endogenous inhibitor of DNA gyrase (YacG/DUF329 family)
MRNTLSEPQLVSHVCPEHGERLVAPVSMTIECFCGKRCDIDVADWVATAREHYPSEDIVELAKQVGIPAAQARAALAEL